MELLSRVLRGAPRMSHYYKIRKRVIWDILDADGTQLEWFHTKAQAERIRKDWESEDEKS